MSLTHCKPLYLQVCFPLKNQHFVDKDSLVPSLPLRTVGGD